MTATDNAILLLIIILVSGLVTAWIGALIATIGHQGESPSQFSDNIVGFLLGCVFAAFGVVGWHLCAM